jgi:alkylated DNA repair dioxygenase AlkB
VTSPDFNWQPSLLDAATEISLDESFSKIERVQLDDESWLDIARAWVTGSDRLFNEIAENATWDQRDRRMYDQIVKEPRLTSGWRASSGRPLEPPILEQMRSLLSRRYGIEFDSVGLNLYRDGKDSVAWHRDKIPKTVVDPLVALVSVGEPRKFLVRRYGGGPSQSFMFGNGDLVVTGGKFQREWEHTVPKVKSAGPRISIAFRHGVDLKPYLG